MAKVYQYSQKKVNALEYTIHIKPNFNKPLPLTSFVSHQNFKAFQFSDKLKPQRNRLFKNFYKPTEVAYELITQDEKTFHSH